MKLRTFTTGFYFLILLSGCSVATTGINQNTEDECAGEPAINVAHSIFEDGGLVQTRAVAIKPSDISKACTTDRDSGQPINTFIPGQTIEVVINEFIDHTGYFVIDFAEEDRHLMSNLGSFNWDDALLQVTLLAAFHGGQEELIMYYRGDFTDTVYNQYYRYSGWDEDVKEKVKNFSAYGKKDWEIKNFSEFAEEVGVDFYQRSAAYYDYWQRGRHDPNRSGINITRWDFQLMGQAITTYERSAHPELVEAIERDLGLTQWWQRKNLFASIPKHFISNDAPTDMSGSINRKAENIAKFLVQVRKDAAKITEDLE